MIVFIVTRTEHVKVGQHEYVQPNRTTMWPPFADVNNAIGLVNSHAEEYVRRGAAAHRTTRFDPKANDPIAKCAFDTARSVLRNVASTLDVSCVRYEQELIEADGARVVFRITQHPVIEAADEQPFILCKKKAST
jgi:hypothetical protein